MPGIEFGVEHTEQVLLSTATRDPNAMLVAGTEEPEEVQTQVPAEPPKRGRGRPRGSTKARQEVAASSAPAASTSPADNDAEGQHGAAPEPAGPAQDSEQTGAPRQQRGRAGSVSQATAADAADADGTDSAERTAAGAAEVQTVAPKKRRGRSSASTSKLNQVNHKSKFFMVMVIVLCMQSITQTMCVNLLNLQY